MESRIKSGNSETANGYTDNKSGGEDIHRINGVFPRKRTLFVVAFIVRLLALGTTFIAAIVMGTDKQTVILPLVGPLPAKYQYTPAFVFFVLGNAIACGYTVFSLIFTLTGKQRASALSVFLLFVTDLLMLVLVSTAAAAATAIAFVARHGNSHTQWRKVCGVYDRFCNRGAVAIFSSFAGVFNFMALTVVSGYTLYRRARSSR